MMGIRADRLERTGLNIVNEDESYVSVLQRGIEIPKNHPEICGECIRCDARPPVCGIDLNGKPLAASIVKHGPGYGTRYNRKHQSK